MDFSLTRTQRLIILMHVALAIVFSWLIPPYEAHDETGHFAYVNHIVQQHELPALKNNSGIFLDQSHQPPLYYLCVAALTFWADRTDYTQPGINTFAFDGTNRHGTRITLRGANEPNLAMHVARWVSALMGGLMIFFVAKSATNLFGRGSTATLATAIAAFNPQAIFMSSMVNNDVMVSVLGAALFFWLIRLSTTPALQAKLRSYILLGGLCGLIVLAKRTGFGLIGFAAIALVYLAWKNRWAVRPLALRVGVAIATMLAVAAPYFVRNYALYGVLVADRNPNDPFTQAAKTTLYTEGVSNALRDGWFAQIFINGFHTFWGTFGWGNVQMPEWAYSMFAVFTALGLMGFGWAQVAPHKNRAANLTGLTNREIAVGLLLFVGSMAVLPLARAIFFQSAQLFVGRYLMPALGAVACMLAWGWRSPALKPSQIFLEKFRLGAVTALLIAGLITSLVTLNKAYALPIQQSTAGNTAALLTFEDANRTPLAQVTGIDAEQIYVMDKEGSRPYAHIKLDWQALARADKNYIVGISVLGYENEVLGQDNGFHLGGNYPTSVWSAGKRFSDEYFVQIEKPCAVLPVQARVRVSLFQLPSSPTQPSKSLRVTDGEGRETLPVIGAFRVAQPPPVWKFWQPPLGAAGNIWLRQAITPTSATAGDTLSIQLTYEVVKAGSPRAKAFVHVLDPSGVLVAQDDHAPHNGFYPTNLWVEGECVREKFTLTLPPTATRTLRLVTGFYSDDGVRFTTPMTMDNDVLELGTVEVR